MTTPVFEHLLKKKFLPSHIAVIMDGNRRWAKKQGFSSAKGHRQGGVALVNLIENCLELGISHVTVYAFSTENWKRSTWEIHALMQLMKRYLLSKKESLKKAGVRLHTIGDVSKLPLYLQNLFQKVQDYTQEENKLHLIVAVNYGGRDELVRGMKKLLHQVEKGFIHPDEVNEKMISESLDTAKFPDPDLIIRTSGEMRLSNFLLWQLAYSEIYVTEKLWPEFDKTCLIKALQSYQQREQRRGK